MSLGRNDPCSCGSMKKFKKCCGDVQQSQNAAASTASQGARVAQDIAQMSGLLSRGAHTEVLNRASALLKKHPDCGPAWNLLGIAQQLTGNDGVHAFEQAAALQPELPDAHRNLGLAYSRASRHREAAMCFNKALAVGVDSAQLRHNLGLSLHAVGDLDNAEVHYQRAFELAPTLSRAAADIARIALQRGDSDAAVTWQLKAVAASGRSGSALNQLGEVFRACQRLDDAVNAFSEAVEQDPQSLSALNNLAVSLAEAQRLKEAIPVFQTLLRLPGCDFQAYENFSEILRLNGHFASAWQTLQDAETRFPDHEQVHALLSRFCFHAGDVDGALRHGRRAIELAPQNSMWHSNLLYFLLHSEAAEPDEILAAHRVYEQKYAPASIKTSRVACDETKRLRIGFVSADFRGHALMDFFAPIAAALARHGDMELHGFYTHRSIDEATSSARQLFVGWHAVHALDNDQLCRLIEEQGIDILVDLSGHSGGNRLPVFAMKPAPVQVSCWGYPGTTGLSAIDYLIADRAWIVDSGLEGQFAEALAIVDSNSVFMPNTASPPVGALPAYKNGHLTFGSFNHPRKLTTRIVALWSELLRQVPSAQLLIAGLEPGDDGETILQRFENHGVDRGRLRLAQRMDVAAYLAMHNEVDLCLNTYPYTGGTTLCHALWMGVPTLTLSGPTLASQTGPSVLRRLGLHDFIWQTDQDFIAAGVRLAGDPSSLAKLRRDLRDRFAASNMGPSQADSVAQGLRQAFRHMWRRHCLGSPAETFELSQLRMQS